MKVILSCVLMERRPLGRPVLAPTAPPTFDQSPAADIGYRIDWTEAMPLFARAGGDESPQVKRTKGMNPARWRRVTSCAAYVVPPITYKHILMKLGPEISRLDSQ